MLHSVGKTVASRSTSVNKFFDKTNTNNCLSSHSICVSKVLNTWPYPNSYHSGRIDTNDSVYLRRVLLELNSRSKYYLYVFFSLDPPFRLPSMSELNYIPSLKHASINGMFP